MAKRVQIRGLTTSQLATTLGRVRELIVDTVKKTVTVHDLATPGGIPLAREDLDNVAAATASAAGKMTAAQVQQQDANTSQIAINQVNISNNAAAIGQNASDISGNTDAIAANAAALASHEGRTDNPHSVTAEQAGALAILQNLGDLDDVSQALVNLAIVALSDNEWQAGVNVQETLISPAKLRVAMNSYLNWPAGQIVIRAGGGTKPGIVLCDGASYPVATFPELYAEIGNTFGGDASNFNVPDPRDAALIASGGAFALGDTGGELQVTIARTNLPAVRLMTVRGEQGNVNTTNANDPVSRTYPWGNFNDYSLGSRSGSGNANHGPTDPMGDGTPLSLPRNPYMALPFYITTGVS